MNADPRMSQRQQAPTAIKRERLEGPEIKEEAAKKAAVSPIETLLAIEGYVRSVPSFEGLAYSCAMKPRS